MVGNNSIGILLWSPEHLHILLNLLPHPTLQHGTRQRSLPSQLPSSFHSVPHAVRSRECAVSVDISQVLPALAAWNMFHVHVLPCFAIFEPMCSRTCDGSK